MTEPPDSDRAEVRRYPDRGSRDREIVDRILDDGYVCHVSFAVDGQPFVLPMAYGREEDRIYLHGSLKSRLQRRLSDGVPCCVAVTRVDGLVLSRSAFDHSMNYRSVVLFGTAFPVEGPDRKREALKTVSEHLVPGRWEEVRPPSEKELSATSVLAVLIEEASAKVRSGPPKDPPKDLDLPHWAGVIPFELSAGEPVADPDLRDGIEPGPSVTGFTP